MKSSSFVLTPYEINWNTLKQDFDNFVNKLCFHLLNSNPSATELTNNNEPQQLDNPPSKKPLKTSNFRIKTINCHSLEALIEKEKQGIFHPNNVNIKIFHNIAKEEREALKETKTWKNRCVRVQGKGSRFVVISNGEYCAKVKTQIDRSSLIKLPHDINKGLEDRVNHFINKWKILRFFIQNGQAI